MLGRCSWEEVSDHEINDNINEPRASSHLSGHVMGRPAAAVAAVSRVGCDR